MKGQLKLLNIEDLNIMSDILCLGTLFFCFKKRKQKRNDCSRKTRSITCSGTFITMFMILITFTLRCSAMTKASRNKIKGEPFCVYVQDIHCV